LIELEISAPSGNNCAWPCNKGICEAGKCVCETSVFGSQCDKVINLMEKEITTFEIVVDPFEHISILETVEEGDKDVNLILVSKTNPKGTLLVNESD